MAGKEVECLPEFPPGVVPDRGTKQRLNAAQSLKRKSVLSGAWSLKLSGPFFFSFIDQKRLSSKNYYLKG